MFKNDKAKKTVWVVSDGIPGHFTQSKGVLFALEHEFELDIHWIELKLKKSFLRRPMAWLLNSTIPAVEKINYFYQGVVLPQQAPDIVIGAGGNTSYAVAWLARAHGAKNIFCGSLRHLNETLFDAILVLEPDLPKPFISLPISAMPISQKTLAVHGEVWHAEHPEIQQKLWTMLIGGEGAGADYQAEDWKQLAREMNSLAKNNNIRWLISTSRRTGAEAEAILKAELNDHYIVDAVWWSEHPRKILHQFLAVSCAVFCGADSMSMMMESISAQRPLIIYSPEKFQPDAKFSNVLKRLESSALAKVVPINELAINDSFQALRPLEYEPSEKLAQLLKERLFS